MPSMPHALHALHASVSFWQSPSASVGEARRADSERAGGVPAGQREGGRRAGGGALGPAWWARRGSRARPARGESARGRMRLVGRACGLAGRAAHRPLECWPPGRRMGRGSAPAARSGAEGRAVSAVLTGRSAAWGPSGLSGRLPLADCRRLKKSRLPRYTPQARPHAGAVASVSSS